MTEKTKTAEHKDGPKVVKEREHAEAAPEREEDAHANALSLGGATCASASAPTPPPKQGCCNSCRAAGNLAVQSLLRAGAQMSAYEVSEPGDPYEREADEAAQSVAGAGSNVMAPATAARSRGGVGVYGRVLPAGAGGRPLGDTARAFFEPRMGQDLRHVRVHTDEHAAGTARALGARAFTLGGDIFFGRGLYAPETTQGRRLLAHELTHVAQQSDGAKRPARGLIQRDPDGTAAAPAATPAPQAPAPGARPTPRAGADHIYFRGVVLIDDREYMKYELRKLIAAQGLEGADTWVLMLQGKGPTPINFVPPVPPAHLAGTGVYKVRSPLDAMQEEQELEKQRRLTPLALEVYAEVRAEALKFIDDFKAQAEDNMLQVLAAQETQAKAEGIRYGITSETIEECAPDLTGDSGGYSSSETTYDMNRTSPAAKGMQAAAKILLARRNELITKSIQLTAHVHMFNSSGGMVADDSWEDEGYAPLAEEIKKKEEEYANLRTQLSAEYPALAAFSDPQQGTGDLETIAEKGPGPDMAALMAAKIAEKLANIEKVRDGLTTGEVNIWRLPKIVDVTAVQFGADTDKEKARLVADKRESEQPGIWGDIALLVLNIGAILLAGPTGGVSLAVAAGVNAAVAVGHVQEYLMKEALTGTAFNKAQAISQDEPSLFWLAVEIVGVAVDVGTAASALAKTFKTLGPLVKSAEAAAKGEEAAKSIEAVRVAATAERDAAFAERVVARLKAIRGGGKSAALEAAGATKKEMELIETVAKAADAEATAGVGKAVQTATGKVTLSRTGHLWTCASPCTMLREKYAEIFAKDEKFMAKLTQLESDAGKAAELQKVAEASGDAAALEKAAAEANKVKQEAAALEKSIQDANPHLLAAPSDEAAVNAVKQAEGEAAVKTGRLSDKTEELERLRPVKENPPAAFKDDPELWDDYIGYYEERLNALKAGESVKPPLSPEAYADFLGKFRRGTKYQGRILEGMREEAGKAVGERTMFKDMAEPVVESNVGVAGKVEGETTKFADQLVVDMKTINEASPTIQSFSNKSREFDKLLKAGNGPQIEQQVLADVKEAVGKYGGDITLRRPDGPLAPLFNKTVKVGKVTLVYDASMASTKEVRDIVQRAAAGSGVEVIFR